MSRENPLDQAIDCSMRRAKRHLSELTKVQNEYLIVMKQLQVRPSASRLKVQISGLEDKALRLAKSLSQDFQGCKSHKDFPLVFREFTERLKSLQRDLEEATVRSELQMLTPNEIDIPSAPSSSVMKPTSPDSKVSSIENEKVAEVDEPDQFYLVPDRSEQKMVTKPLCNSKKRRSEEVNVIAHDVDTIAQTFEDLNDLVVKQKVNMEEIVASRNYSKLSIESAKRNILHAAKYKSKIILTVGGTVIGGLVGGPVGAAALGLKAGVGIGFGTSVIGGMIGHKESQKVQKKLAEEVRVPWDPQESNSDIPLTDLQSISLSEKL